MAEWNFRLRATLDDRGKVSKMVTEPLEKDWEKWDEEHPYEPHPRTGNEAAGSQHDEHGTPIDLHGSSGGGGHPDPVSSLPAEAPFGQGVDAINAVKENWANAFTAQDERLTGGQRDALHTYLAVDASDPGWKGDEANPVSYSTVNSALRGDGDLDSDKATLVSNLDSAINGGNTLSSDTTLYRGIQGDAGDLKEGSVMQDEAYLSTSTDESSAQSFSFGENGNGSDLRGSGYVMQISAPSGTNYLVGEPTEREVLLGRNTSLVVDRVDMDAKAGSLNLPKVYAHVEGS